MALLSKFFGRTASEGAAFALGIATGPVLAPAVESIKNEAWRTDPSRAVDPITAAAIVAEDVEAMDWGAHEAAAHGINRDNFTAIVSETLNAPGMGELLQARRRGLVTDVQFRHGLRKAKLEERWDTALLGLLDVLLTPAELANAVVQGHMTQDAAAVEAAKQGIDRARFDVLVANTGLPPGPETGLAWLRRGILTTDEFGDVVREGHTKVKYIQKYLDALHPILSAAEYAGLALRGWISRTEMYDGGALSGYSTDQMDLLYRNRGRPATVHQIHIGYARGATVPGAANEEDAIRQSVRRSNVRTEYEDVLYASRYTLPTWFALRALLTGGAISEARAASLLKQSGWPPALAEEVAAFYAPQGPAATPADPNVTKAHNQLWTAAHRSYLLQEIDRAQAETTLARFVTDAQARNAVLDTWDAERDVTIKSLTPSQVKSAYTQSVIPLDTALAELTRLGYDQESAARLLGTVQPVVAIPQVLANVEADVRAGTVDAVEAIARLTAVGLKAADAAGLVQTWETGGVTP